MNDPMNLRGLLQRSMTTIDRLEAKIAQLEGRRSKPVAIVGTGCRFPGGSTTPEAFWNFVRNGGDAVTEIPKTRWDIDAIFSPDPDAPGRTYARWGAFIDDVEHFDPAFFGISPREAKSLDPQQRLLLETSWEALENAGIAPDRLAGSNTGVFVGMTAHDFAMHAAARQNEQVSDAYAASGSTHSIAAGRLSYFLDARGPNFVLDTACSSSMVAIHSAIKALRSGEADMALAGGVTLTLTSVGSVLTARARMMSFTGRCHTFDAAADGYVRGEGCAMLVLKRLADAERDGDRILAVIRGTAINQDGRSAGMTAPNGRAQVDVLCAALADAGLASDQVDYIEAHGTGTSLGDPIEVNALAEVYGARPVDAPLLVGSVKTNIGHTEGAAGVAGLIKAAYAVKHGEIPPHLNFETPNPLIPWQDIAIKIPVERTRWPGEADRQRRAGVSSFGFSGTNAHMVLEQPPAAQPAIVTIAEERATILALSARSPDALRDIAIRLAAHMRAHEDLPLAKVAAELALGRSHLNARLALVGADRDDALAQLDAAAAGQLPANASRSDDVPSGDTPEIVFMFTGQGAQYSGMARGLYDSEPVFRDALDRCAATLDRILPVPLLEVMFGEAPEMAALLDDTAYTQPVLFSLEWSLAELWRSWGIKPSGALGHSVGEYVAVCVAGALPVEDGLKLIAERGRLMASLPRDGAMAAVIAPEAEVRRALAEHPGEVTIAAVNGPESTVIAGRESAVDALVESFRAAEVRAQRLAVSHAFHSPLMDPILGDIERVTSGLNFSEPEIALASNVTGRLAATDEFRKPGYWRRHTREAVRFAASVESMLAEGFSTFLEIGPSSTLAAMAQQCPGANRARWVPSLRRGVDDRVAMLSAIGGLYANGHTPDWSAIFAGGTAARSRVALPTYPFRRERYGLENISGGKPGLLPSRSGHPFLEGAIAGAVQVVRGKVGLASAPWLSGHRIYDFEPLPGAALIDIAVSAAREVDGHDRHVLRNVDIVEGLILTGMADVELQVVIDAPQAGARVIRVYSAVPEEEGRAPDWRLHLKAQLEDTSSEPVGMAPAEVPADAQDVDVPGYYDWLAGIGVHYGPSFRAIETIRRTAKDGWATLRLPEGLDLKGVAVHTSMLDCCIQLFGALLMEEGTEHDAFMPVSIEECRIARAALAEARCHLRRIDIADPDLRRCDIDMRDAKGNVALQIRGLELRRVSRSTLDRIVAARAGDEWLFELAWEAAPLPISPPPASGGWLILADQGGVGARLAEALGAAGASVVLRDAAALPTIGDAQAGGADGPLAAMEALVAAARNEAGGSLDGVVNLLPLDHAGTAQLPEIEATHAALLGTALGLAEATAPHGLPAWVVTRGAQSVAGEMPDLGQAPLISFAGVVSSEYPGAPMRRIDLDPHTRDGEVDLLLRSLLAADAEDQMAFRGQTRLAARLVKGSLHPPAETAPVVLDIPQRGVLENLELRPQPRTFPGPGEVEVRVRATGVNFRDVLNALGMYPGDPGPLGSECAGEVTAVGAGVDHLSVGDDVVAMTDASFATYVTTSAKFIVRKPPGLTMAEAAGTPVAFLTAYYALHHLGNVQPGDRVLIHAVTGGVGMAAAQIARMLGAEVYGTAGTPAKRALALAQGAVHVGDSRSTDFAADLMDATGGRGVNFVLNALSGDFIPASLSVLAEGGCFVEIGKTDEWNAERVTREYPGVAYHQLYLGDLTATNVELVCDMLETLYRCFEDGSLQPLSHRAWALEDAEAAMRFMAQGLHTGKIVMAQTRPEVVRADASYIVTGGLRGVGLRTAQWLAEAGARHLVLLSRSGASPESAQAIEALQAAGVTVLAEAADITDAADLRRVLDRVAEQMPPLRGVIHAAGVLDDAMLPDQTPERIARVMAPKVRGALALHEATRTASLDFFVMFASGAGLMGAPGQANYAAANGFLDAFAAWRRGQGLPGLSIDWGSWSEIGMAASVGERHQKRWAAMGLMMIAPDRGVRLLSDVLFGSERGQVAILPLMRARLPANAGPLFGNLLTRTEKRDAPQASVRESLAEAAPEEREAVLNRWLCDQVIRVLALEGTLDSEHHRSLLELGMDSLMAMELQNRVESGVGVTVRAAELLNGLSLAGLTQRILRELSAVPEGDLPGSDPDEEREIGLI